LPILATLVMHVPVAWHVVHKMQGMR